MSFKILTLWICNNYSKLHTVHDVNLCTFKGRSMGKISGHIFMQISESTIATLINYTCVSFIKLTPVIYSFLLKFFHY